MWCFLVESIKIRLLRSSSCQLQNAGLHRLVLDTLYYGRLGEFTKVVLIDDKVCHLEESVFITEDFV